MTDWEYFGLERGSSTERDAKRAYSRLLKQHRPDVDPAGFMELQERYERIKLALEGPSLIEPEVELGEPPSADTEFETQTDHDVQESPRIYPPEWEEMFDSVEAELEAEKRAELERERAQADWNENSEQEDSETAQTWAELFQRSVAEGTGYQKLLREGFDHVDRGDMAYGWIIRVVLDLDNDVSSLSDGASELSALLAEGHCYGLTAIVERFFEVGAFDGISQIAERVLARPDYDGVSGIGEFLLFLFHRLFLFQPELAERLLNRAYEVLPLELRHMAAGGEVDSCLAAGNELSGSMNRQDVGFWTSQFHGSAFQQDWTDDENIARMKRLPLKSLVRQGKAESIRCLLGEEQFRAVCSKLRIKLRKDNSAGGWKRTAVLFLYALGLFVAMMVAPLLLQTDPQPRERLVDETFAFGTADMAKLHLSGPYVLTSEELSGQSDILINASSARSLKLPEQRRLAAFLASDKIADQAKDFLIANLCDVLKHDSLGPFLEWTRKWYTPEEGAAELFRLLRQRATRIAAERSAIVRRASPAVVIPERRVINKQSRTVVYSLLAFHGAADPARGLRADAATTSGELENIIAIATRHCGAFEKIYVFHSARSETVHQPLIEHLNAEIEMLTSLPELRR